MKSRRQFLKTVAVGATGFAMGMTAKSYARILGSNERVNFAVIGLHGRGYAHMASIMSSHDAFMSHVCDVDQQELNKFAAACKKNYNHDPVKIKDVRRLLESKDVDAISIATPEHWQAHIAVMGVRSGKHVYVEKPSSHNPREGELLVEAQKKYGKLIQLGDQQRSSPHTIEIISRIKGGLIGKPYLAKSWYSNTRKSIGIGKVVDVPEYLDWELWQGPAPRRPYKDNIHPYNWHWFWHWGTGETLNNGTHEVDICRWALGVNYPKKVRASGGRYHFRDDWEFYDTLTTSYEYEDKMITWEGTSCQGKKQFGRDRGSAILGTNGTVIVDRLGYEVFDLDDKKVDQFYVEKAASSTQDLVSVDSMTDAHFQNLIDGIRKGEPLHSPISEGNVSVTILHLSNIAWKVGRTLNLDERNAHIQNDSEAEKFWSREYEKGWELKV